MIRICERCGKQFEATPEDIDICNSCYEEIMDTAGFYSEEEPTMEMLEDGKGVFWG